MMIQHSIPFSPELEGWWCVILTHQIYLPGPKNKIPFGSFDDLAINITRPDVVHQIGEYDGDPVYTLDATHILASESDLELDEFVGLRSILFEQNELFEFAARAYQVQLFLKTHQYCGQCGSPMQIIDWELATLCEPCKHRCYPRISPVVIVAIRKGSQILLAKNKRSTANIYSVLAGFVESGETLEQAVHREVFEEVGIKVKNIKYVKSQPWPFPHSLMVGFVAEYDSGELNLCDDEIEAADWFEFGEDMPPVPPFKTISRQLIEHTKKLVRK